MHILQWQQSHTTSRTSATSKQFRPVYVTSDEDNKRGKRKKIAVRAQSACFARPTLLKQNLHTSIFFCVTFLLIKSNTPNRRGPAEETESSLSLYKYTCCCRVKKMRRDKKTVHNGECKYFRAWWWQATYAADAHLQL